MRIFRSKYFALAVVLVVATAFVAGCGKKPVSAKAGSVQVADKNVVDATSLTENPDVPQPASTFTVPGAAFVDVDSETYGVVRSLTGLAHPLQKVALINLSSGKTTDVLPQAAGHENGFDITDARASDECLVWVESKMATGEWRIYRSALSGVELSGTPQLLGKGNKDKETPTIAVWKDTALWTDSPLADLRTDKDFSIVYASAVGQKEVQTVYKNAAPFASSIQIVKDALTVPIRAPYKGSNRTEIYVISPADGKEIDSMYLPVPISVSDAVYLDGRFSFSVMAKYDGVGAIGNVGTYVQSNTGGNSAGTTPTFIRFPRTPMDTPQLFGPIVVGKNGKSNLIVNVEKKTVAVLIAPEGSPDYGEFLATHGVNEKLVTFTQPTNTDPTQTVTVIRVFNLQ